LCEKCFKDIEKHYYFDQICYVCKKYSLNFEVHKKCKNKVYFDKTIILTHYKIKLIKKLVLNLKFYYKREIADDFAEYMVDKFIKYAKDELKEYKKNDFIILYSPTSFFRKLVR
jgi:predicted amidophosphoribosyltransferase